MDVEHMFAHILTIDDDQERERYILHYIMEQRAISTSDVAKVLGYTPRYIQYILAGKYGGTRALDKIDVAVAEITEQRGGIRGVPDFAQALERYRLRVLMED